MSKDHRPSDSLDARPRIFPGWWIVATGFVAQMVIIGATGFVFSVMVLPMSQDLGWSRSALVGVLVFTSAIEGIVSARLGPLVDRHGSRLLTALSALLCGVCFLLMSQVNQLWQYYACWVGIGFAAPGLMTIGPRAAIANWFVRKRALAFTIFSFGSATAGVVLAPLISSINSAAGWRAGWQAMAILAFTVIPLAWFLIRRRPEDVGLLPDGNALTPASDPASGVARKQHVMDDEPEWTVGEALRTRAFWLLVLAFAMVGIPGSAIYVHMAAYVADKGFSVSAGATTLSLYGIGILVGRPLWGIILARTSVRWLLVVFGFAYAVGIAAFMLPSSLLAVYATVFVLGLSIAPGQQLNAQAFPDYFGRRIVAALFGYAGLAFIITRAAAPLFFAVTFDATGSYIPAFGVCVVACVIAGFSFLLATPPVHKEGSESPVLVQQGAD